MISVVIFLSLAALFLQLYGVRHRSTTLNPAAASEPLMKKFLAVYTGTAAATEKSNWGALTVEKRKELETRGIKAWGEWMRTHQAVIVDAGGPLGKTKRTDRQGISDTHNNLAGYVIIRAESQDAAAQMFKDHPHFTIFPGDAVEIMECLSPPNQ